MKTLKKSMALGSTKTPRLDKVQVLDLQQNLKSMNQKPARDNM